MRIDIRGVKTSEFKVVVGLVLLVLIGVFGALSAGALEGQAAVDLVKWVIGTSGLLGGSYAVSRGLAKGGKS